MNGATARTLRIVPTFLAAGRYVAVLVGDDSSNAAAVRLDRVEIGRGDMLTIELREGGGFVARLVPQKAGS